MTILTLGMAAPRVERTVQKAAPPEPAPSARSSAQADGLWRHGAGSAIIAVFLLYLLLRVLAWRAAVLVEDHGSISQLVRAKVFLTFDLRQIAALEPDTTPFYPLSVAFFSLPGWSLETAARLCSLAFSAGLFFALMKLGQRIAPLWAVVAGLVLLSLNPVLVRLSPAILTEPSYIATVYVGLWLFWSQYDRPTLGKAAVLGLIFGLAFLNRVEALLFLAAVPVFQAMHYFGARERSYSARHLEAWVLAFVAGFVILAAPQVGWESQRMGRFAINGRQVWSEVLVQKDQQYERQIYGLDYSPFVVNLTYLQAHPVAVQQTDAPAGKPIALRYLHLVLENLKDLGRHQLPLLIGVVGCTLFVLGLWALAARGQQADALLVIGFIAVTLAGPLVHDVEVRHILVMAPLMLLVAGIGAVSLAARLSSWAGRRQAALVAALLLLLVIGSWGPALGRAFRRQTCNYEYCVDTMARASQIARASGRELGRPPRVSARKQYLAYFSGGTAIALPYTDYDGLVRYLRANGADFVFLEKWMIGSYPFVADFGNRAPGDFTLLDREIDRQGRTSELYRLAPGPSSAAGLPPRN